MPTLVDINDRFNKAITYTKDKGDHWQTPNESLKRRKGDCEDIAIAKFFALLADEDYHDSVQLAYVKHEKLGAHMICMWSHLVLDNIDTELKHLTQRRDLLIVYSFNETYATTWKDGIPYKEFDVNQISKWIDLLERIEN